MAGSLNTHDGGLCRRTLRNGAVQRAFLAENRKFRAIPRIPRFLSILRQGLIVSGPGS
jgi:hypothetical protein